MDLPGMKTAKTTMEKEILDSIQKFEKACDYPVSLIQLVKSPSPSSKTTAVTATVVINI